MPRRSATVGQKGERPGLKPGRSRDLEQQLHAIERGSGDGDLDFGRGVTLHVSSLGKTYFPDSGVTKGDLMRYYTRVWPVLGPHVKDRPLVLKRFPDGITGEMFYQQNAGTNIPDAVRVENIIVGDEGPKPRIVGGDLVTQLYTVQIGAIEVHPWLAKFPDVGFTDRCLIDLDPPEDVPYSAAVSLARDVVSIANACSLPMGVKTSGSSGIHLVIPLPPRTLWETSAALALLIAKTVSAHHPDSSTTERSVRSRPAGSIYVDAMQNARGKSMACAYSVRPREPAAVSAPLRATELTARLRIEAFTTRTIPARVVRFGDIWGKAMATRPTKRVIENALVALERAL